MGGRLFRAVCEPSIDDLCINVVLYKILSMSLEGLPRSINPDAYKFIEAIAKAADEKLFPETIHRSLIMDPGADAIKYEEKNNRRAQIGNQFGWECEKTGKTWVWSGTDLRQKIGTLPPEMAVKIAGYASNFSEFVLMLGLMNPKVKMPKEAVEIAAADMLRRLPDGRSEHSLLSQLSSNKEKLLAAVLCSVIGAGWTKQLPSIGNAPFGLQRRVEDVYLLCHWKLWEIYNDQNWNHRQRRIITAVVLDVACGLVLISAKALPWIMHQELASLAQAAVRLLYCLGISFELGLFVWRPIADGLMKVVNGMGMGQSDPRRPYRERILSLAIRGVVALMGTLLSTAIGSVVTIPALRVVLWNRAWFAEAWSQVTFFHIKQAFMHRGTLLTHMVGATLFGTWILLTGVGLGCAFFYGARYIESTLANRVLPWHDAYTRNLEAKRIYSIWMYLMQHPEDLYLPQ